MKTQPTKYLTLEMIIETLLTAAPDQIFPTLRLDLEMDTIQMEMGSKEPAKEECADQQR